jgi:hypothetical protein
VASSDHAPFSNHEINQQALANAASLPYLMIAYGVECGWSARETALFCGRIFAKGWERLRGAGARVVARQIAINLVSTGGVLQSLVGDERRAEARVSGLPDPVKLDIFEVGAEDTLQFCDVFAPMATYVSCRFAWRVEGDEIVSSVHAPPGEPGRVPAGAADDAAITDDDIHQQALANASSLPYLVAALAGACDLSPDNAAAFAASRYARLWDPVRDNNPLSVARRIALNVVSCGGELVRLSGDEQGAEVSVAGVPTDAEAAFFGVALGDVDRIYGVLCLEAELLGYKATWRREGNEIIFSAQRPG